MLQTLTDRERRILLAIVAVLVLGGVVKLWRWRTQQHSEPIEPVPADAGIAPREAGWVNATQGAFPALTLAVGCVDGE